MNGSIDKKSHSQTPSGAEISAAPHAESELEILVDYAPDAVFLVDAVDAGRFRYVRSNRQHGLLTGIPPETIRGRTPHEVLGAEGGDTAAFHFEACRKSRRRTEYEETVDLPDGVKTFHTVLEPVVKSAAVVRIVGFSRDITHQKQTEDTLQESEKRYRLLIEASNDIVWTFDLSSMIFSYRSRSAEPVLGYKIEDSERITLDRIFSPETEKEIRAAFKDFLDGKVASNMIALEAPHRHAEGGHVWMEINAVLQRDSRNRPAAVTGVSRDISARKRAEEALRESEEKYRATFTASSDAISITSMDGIYVEINEAFTRLTGYDKQEVVGRSVSDIGIWARPEDRKIMTDNLRQYGCARNLEFMFRGKHGAVYFGLTSADLFTLNGKQHILTITRDITSQKKMEEEKEMLHSRLRHVQKMEALGTLTGGVAHDFNNILSIIMGYAELVQEDVNHSQQAANNLEEVRKAVMRARNVVKHLMTFSRKGESDRTEHPIAIEIKQSVELMKTTVPDSVTIRESISDNLPLVMGEPVQIRQVAVNLVKNASEAMEETGGVVTIELDSVALSEADISFAPELNPGDYVRLRVTDTGHGIASGDIDRIFDPYFTTRDIGKGSGLGLSVVLGIVKNHGGGIRATSEPGKGACFEVFFPVSPRQ